MLKLKCTDTRSVTSTALCDHIISEAAAITSESGHSNFESHFHFLAHIIFAQPSNENYKSLLTDPNIETCMCRKKLVASNSLSDLVLFP